ncbi:TPA: hypothetical protein HA251_06240 [Candidatus Woesearchaeota archaeon]|nr:hypothetical protein [Candidatus Woesearchaeota archaeon]
MRVAASLLALLLSGSADERTGVKDLHNNVRRCMDEEVSAYTSHGWVALTKKAMWNATDVDRGLLYRLHEEEPSLSIYHTHPAECRLTHIVQHRSFVLPSEHDINNAIVGETLFRMHHPTGAYAHRIVSLFGVTTISLTSEGHSYFADHWRESETYARTWWSHVEPYTTKILPIPSLIAIANDAYICVEFTPYN